MNSIQSLAAFVMLLVNGPPNGTWPKSESENSDVIRQTFKTNHLLYLEIGGQDWTRELINLYVASVQHIIAGKVPPLDVMRNFGFAGEYAHWFWTKISEIGEDAYFANPPGFFKEEFTPNIVRTMEGSEITEGWMLVFVEGAMHEMYHTQLKQRAVIDNTMKRESVKRPVFQFLKHFKK